MLTSEKRISIKSWAVDDRPREKLLLKGRHNLSDVELTAIIIGSGSDEESALELSRRILQSCGNELDKLGKLSVSDLLRFRGIGRAKAVSIVAALELGRRRKESGKKEGKRITGSSDVYKIMLPFMEDLSQEEFWMIALNRANRIISKKRISQGGLSGTVADPRTIFKSAIEQLASAVIFCHNHPSGNTKPSEADKELTEKLVASGDILEITVLDHVIISDRNYFSFADEGLI